MVEFDEAVVVRKCIAGDRRYQELLYSNFCKKMMGICFRYSGNREEAEDLLQEGFIKVFTSLGQFKMKGSLEGWIRRIITNTIFEKLRKKDVLRNAIEIEGVEGMEEGPVPETMDEFHDLIKLVQQLPEGYRAVFNMHAIDGYTHKEIARELGISEGTSKSQYHAARKSLRSKIELLSAHG